MIGQIFGALKAIKSIIEAVRGIFAFIEANKTEQWFQDSAKVFSKIQKLDNDDDRKKAAKDMRELISRM